MDARDLEQKLSRLEGRGYKAYQEIRGRYQFPFFRFYIDKVQPDPFAPPSRVRIVLPYDVAGLPKDTYHNPSRRVGLENYLASKLRKEAQALSKRLGMGKSGLILVHAPGQEILLRSTVSVSQKGDVEARFFVGLPAAGRRILAREAKSLLLEGMPLLARALCFKNLDRRLLYAFVETCEDADFLRQTLASQRLVAFVGEGSILPRASGVDPRPASKAVPFQSPPELTVEIELPNRGRVKGMGIPEGITLIVGGGFHGKSTLLQALEYGIYNHVPGDGRELVVSRYEGVKIRAEDGRSIFQVDISGFITNLPFGQDTHCFSTPCASGSTSQAANIMEALEVGARVFFIDEDTSATNFMIRDARMQALISKEKEPITPYLDRVRELYESLGVSSVLVIGGSGDYLEVADTVIAMDHYHPHEVTEEARLVVQKYPSSRQREVKTPLNLPQPRGFQRARFPQDRKGPRAKGLAHILWSRELIDLSAVEQLVSADQTRALALGLEKARALLEEGLPLPQAVARIEKEIQEQGLLFLSPHPRGDLAFFRRFELAAAFNRLRSLVENL